MSRPHNTPDVFRAVAHPVRRHMLMLLRRRDQTPAELAQSFHISKPTISEHIRALRIAGLIVYRERGSHHVYSLVRTRLRPIEEWLKSLQKPL